MEILQTYFPNLTPKQVQQFGALKKLYSDWNQQINVISRKDTESFYEQHVLHSLGIAKVIQFKEGTRVLDIGTGGGFPGIPLAILFPDVEFHLVDSIGKKIKVVNAIKEELKLSNVFAEQKRAEEVKGQFDFIVSRAVTRLSNFLPWVKGKLTNHSKNEFPNGMFFLKGGDLKEEIEEVDFPIEEYQLKDFFAEEFFETKKVLFLSPFIKTI